MEQERNTGKLEAIADWWTAQIRALPHHDNGDTLQSNMGRWAAASSHAKITAAQYELFRQYLIERLPAWLEKHRTIMVDYDPCQVLHDAAAWANIPDLVFPWKTVMHVHDDEVLVGAGYGAPLVTIWKEAAR